METKKNKAERVSIKEKKTIAALAATGESSRAIARSTGRDQKTILKILKYPDVIADKADFGERFASKLEHRSETILDSISEEDLLKASLQQKSISVCALIDKARLIRGQSTTNTAIIMANAVIEADKLASETAQQSAVFTQGED